MTHNPYEEWNKNPTTKKLKYQHESSKRKGVYRGNFADPSSGRFLHIKEPEKSIRKILTNYKKAKIDIELAVEYIKDIIDKGIE